MRVLPVGVQAASTPAVHGLFFGLGQLCDGAAHPPVRAGGCFSGRSLVSEKLQKR